MFAWFKKTFGRGSKVDAMIRALPNLDRVLAGARAWADTTRDLGDALAAWEPQEGLLVDVIRTLADAGDLLGPMVDGGATGSEKLAAMTAKMRMAAMAVGMADHAFDSFWLNKGRPLLEAYIARLRG